MFIIRESHSCVCDFWEHKVSVNIMVSEERARIPDVCDFWEHKVSVNISEHHLKPNKYFWILYNYHFILLIMAKRTANKIMLKQTVDDLRESRHWKKNIQWKLVGEEYLKRNKVLYPNAEQSNTKSFQKLLRDVYRKYLRKYLAELKESFFVACQNGHVGRINALLARNEIQINERNVHGRNARGTTPLYIACANGHLNIVKVLLARKEIQINAYRDDGATPLYIACANGHFNIAKVLLARKEINGIISRKKFIHCTFPDETFRLNADETFLMADSIDCPVRCLPCKHPFEAASLLRWFSSIVHEHEDDHITLLNTKCPNCMIEATDIEVMSMAKVQKWNKMSALEKTAESDLNVVRSQIDEHPIRKMAVERTAIERQLSADEMTEASQVAEIAELNARIREIRKKRETVKKSKSATRQLISEGHSKVNDIIRLINVPGPTLDKWEKLIQSRGEAKKAIDNNKLKNRFKQYVKRTKF